MQTKLLADAQLKVTTALPASNTSATSTAIDLVKTANADTVANFELLVSVPACNTTQLPDAATHKFDIVHSDNADLSSPTTIAATVYTQTGAGGVGAAAGSFRFKFPDAVKRYVGV